MSRRGVAPKAINLELDARAACEVAGVAAQDASDVNDRALSLARVGYFENRARHRLDYAAISDLPAALGIEGRLRDDDGNLIAVLASRREHFGLAFVSMVADEAGCGARAEIDLRRGRVVFARGASALFLLFHQAVEARDVDIDGVIAQDVLGQIERKSVSVVQLERDLAGQSMTAALFDAREFGVDQFQSSI